jgi:hypothetical protein
VVALEVGGGDFAADAEVVVLAFASFVAAAGEGALGLLDFAVAAFLGDLEFFLLPGFDLLPGFVGLVFEGLEGIGPMGL